MDRFLDYSNCEYSYRVPLRFTRGNKNFACNLKIEKKKKKKKKKKNKIKKKKKKKKKKDKRKPFINFCVCNPQEQTRTFTLKQTISLSFCKSFVFKIYTFYDNYPVRFRM